MEMKKKGILPISGAIFTVVIGILAMIFAYLVFYYYLGVKTQTFVDVSRFYQLSMVSSEIKNFLRLSSLYSFDQSVYEIFGRGIQVSKPPEKNLEFLDDIQIWMEEGKDNSPTSEELKGNIYVRYESIISEYLAQLKSKQYFIMENPVIENVNLELKSSEPLVSLTTMIIPMKIGTSPYSYVLVDSTVNRQFNYLIKDVYNKGKDLLSYSTAVSNSMKELNYCMSDEEIKNKICSFIEQIEDETELIKWNFICEKEKIEINKEKTDGSRILKLKVYSLVTVEDKKSEIFVFDGIENSWKKIQLRYYIINKEITSVECCPGETKQCTDQNGCSATQKCGNDYKWGSCVAECKPGDTAGQCTKPDGSKGTLTCVKSDSTCKYECK